jgi:hypothetical protein
MLMKLLVGRSERRERRLDDLSLFHALRWLVFILVGVVVRIVAVHFVRLAFALDAVGVLRADE